MTDELKPKRIFRPGPGFLEHYWKPGQSGNPAGRPKGAKSRLSEDFLKAMADDFAKHGREAIARVRKTDPSTYLHVLSRIVPKDLNIHADVGAELIEALKALNATEPTVYSITGPEPDEPAPLRN